MQLPPTVNLVLLFSFFSGRTLHTNDPYVTSFLRSWGISFLRMNWIVLVGFLILCPMPLASRPNSLADDMLHCCFFVHNGHCLMNFVFYLFHFLGESPSIFAHGVIHFRCRCCTVEVLRVCAHSGGWWGICFGFGSCVGSRGG
jgi:hypothetical protein